MSQSKMKIEMSSNPEYVSIIRLTLSGLANKMGFNIDDIEDLKVAVSEACANAIKHSNDSNVTVEFREIDNGIEVEVADNGKGYNSDNIEKPNLSEPKESGLGLFIIEALMDEVKMTSYENKGTIVTMKKYLGVDK